MRTVTLGYDPLDGMYEFATDQEILVELTKPSEICSNFIIDSLIADVAEISR